MDKDKHKFRAEETICEIVDGKPMYTYKSCLNESPTLKEDRRKAEQEARELRIVDDIMIPGCLISLGILGVLLIVILIVEIL